jgi:peptidoglycan hydrolase-like protein with peptidoglycan-binding domain
MSGSHVAFVKTKSTKSSNLLAQPAAAGGLGAKGPSAPGRYGKYRRRPRWPWLYSSGYGYGVSQNPAPGIPWAQSCLAQTVGSWVPQDGVLGPGTRRAIKMFQTQQQLQVTGMLDGPTVAALQGSCAGQAGPAPTYPPTPGPMAAPGGPAGAPQMPPETQGPPEAAGEVGQYEYGEQESMLNEMQEIALAAELSGITSEQELEQFLGNLIQDIGKSVKGFANSAAGQTVGGILKSAGKLVLPIAGTAAGAYFGGPAGAQIGGQLGSTATQILGLEVGEMSQQDREFETARQFVRFARDAVKRTVNAEDNLPPFERARQAVVEASQQYAPGLVNAAQAIADNPETLTLNRPRAGRWTRQGKNIIIHSI